MELAKDALLRTCTMNADDKFEFVFHYETTLAWKQRSSGM
jgi:hypothetical protein